MISGEKRLDVKMNLREYNETSPREYSDKYSGADMAGNLYSTN